MKTLVFLATLIVAALAAESDLRSAETIFKPNGKPLFIHASVPAIENKPQIEYISSLNNQDDYVKPTWDYISAPIDDPKPVVEYISNRRPTSYDYISSYPNYNYNSYIYNPYPTYEPVERGYRTGYQYIKPSVTIQQAPVTTTYPARNTYYPINNGYQYNYRYYPQYNPSIASASYLPIYPF